MKREENDSARGIKSGRESYKCERCKECKLSLIHILPERESIASFAAHHATMVIFLSTGMLKKLSEELIKGGYEADTPAAIVYKATWPDEKRVVCTVATLAEAAEQENIKKTALIIVGDVTAQAGYERSRLYAPEFTTEFRQGTDGFVYE